MAFPSITWTPRFPPPGYHWSCVIWVSAQSRYWACGWKLSTGEGVIAYSPTGATWIAFTADEVKVHKWYGITYHEGTERVVVVGGSHPDADSTNLTGKCITSDDFGASWVTQAIDNNAHGSENDTVDWGSVVALPSGRLVAAAALTFNAAQPFVAYSDDGGDSWTKVTAPSPYDPAGSHSTGTTWGRIAAKTNGSRLVVANTESDSGAAYSDDEGETWSLGTMPASSGDALGSAAAWSPTLSVFGIAGAETAHPSSVWTGDGATWTNRFRLDTFDLPSTLSGSIAWIGAATPFWLVAGNPTNPPTDTSYARASYDGATWFDSAEPATTGVAPWTGIAYSPSLLRIVMVSAAGDIVTGDIVAEVPPDGGGAGPAGGFTDAFNHIIDTGFGVLEYRLMIESWPEEFVTVDWITHANGRDGRAVYKGLTVKGTGARRSERVEMQHGKVQADALAFKIRATDGLDRPLQSLSHYPTPIGQLAESLDADVASATLVGGTLLRSSGVYHIGTEALRVIAPGDPDAGIQTLIADDYASNGSWPDRTASDNDMAQSVITTPTPITNPPPTRHASGGANDRAYLQFGGTQDLLLSSGLSGFADWSAGDVVYAAIVCRFEQSGTNQDLMRWERTSGAPLVSITKNTADNLVCTFVSNAGTRTLTTASAVAIGVDLLIELWFDAATHTVSVSINGAAPLTATNASDTGLGFNVDTVTIGSRFQASRFFTGRVYEVRAWDAYDAALQTAVRTYVADRYDLNIADAAELSLQRHIWASLRQSHWISDSNAARATFVYERPLTMQGLRAYLFAYGERDDGAGDGSLVWRGIVNRPPRRDRDGKTWVIDTDAITKLLMQNVAGALDEAHPVGIYHHAHCAFAFRIYYDGVLGEVIRYAQWDPDEATFLANANEKIRQECSDRGITELVSGQISLSHSPGEPFTISVTPSTDGALHYDIGDIDLMHDFWIEIGSPIIGVVSSKKAHWEDRSGKDRRGSDPAEGALGDGPASAYRLLCDVEYHCVLERGNRHAGDLSFRGFDDGFMYEAPVSPLGYASFLMEAIPTNGVFIPGNSFFIDPDSTLPANRIYIDKDLSDATALAISDTFGRGVYRVTGSGVSGGANYVEVDFYIPGAPPGGATPEQHAKDIMLRIGGFNGFLTGATTINAVRQYVARGSLVDFIAALKVAAVDANLGDTPQLTDADATPWEFGDAPPSAQQLLRLYAFTKPHTLEEVLAEECKFVLHFMRLTLDCKLELKPLPLYAEADDVDDDHVLDITGIVTPGQGYGSWPGYEPQRDGIATTLEVNDRYDYREDDWIDKPFVKDDPNVIATHKGRGKTVLSIKPYSLPADDVLLDPSVYSALADAFFAVFGLDYTIVTLECTIRHYRVLAGDVVRIRHHEIPAGDGTKGMVDRLGVVIGRSVPIDVSASATINLDVLVYLEPVYGYAPSAFITAQTDNGGNEWQITCDPTDDLNLEWSGGEDGQVLGRFKDGFRIRLVRMDSSAEVSVAGAIVGTPDAEAGTGVVQLDGTWTPGSFQWRMEFSNGADLTEEQRRYAVNAGTSLQIYDGHFARRFG